MGSAVLLGAGSVYIWGFGCPVFSSYSGFDPLTYYFAGVVWWGLLKYMQLIAEAYNVLKSVGKLTNSELQ